MDEASTSRGLPWYTRRTALRLAALLLIATIGGCAMFRMPGRSYDGDLEPLSADRLDLSVELKGYTTMLAGQIGDRNVFHPAGLKQAEAFIEKTFRDAGYRTERQEYEAMGRVCANIIAEKQGTARSSEIIVLGAHYDSFSGCPGANDNASGVAALLSLARLFSTSDAQRTVRFVAFVNEEPPFFQTPQMGSLVYAGKCRSSNDNIVAMLSLETIGYYTDVPKSQAYPFPFGMIYPSTGNFVGFMGNFSSRRLVRQCIGAFRRRTKFPSQGGAVPAIVPELGYSDHWSFWQHGYKAIMVTDTAFFRYRHYHTTDDTPDKVQYDNLARVVTGLCDVIEDLAGPDSRN